MGCVDDEVLLCKKLPLARCCLNDSSTACRLPGQRVSAALAELGDRIGGLLLLASFFHLATTAAKASCLARWKLRRDIDFLGYQASHYKLSAMLREEDPEADPEWVESAAKISLGRAVVVHHLYSLWRDEANIPLDARIEWSQVLDNLKKISLLEDLLREKAESDGLFLDEAMSGMAFMRCMIDGWEAQHPDAEDDEHEEAAEDALVFSSRMEGAFFFLDAAKLRQIRNRLREGRKQSDLRVLQDDDPSGS